MYKPRFKVVFSNERIITPSGLGIIGGMLGKSDLVKRCNRIPVDKKRSEPQIKNGDILLSYIGLLCQGKPYLDHGLRMNGAQDVGQESIVISTATAFSGNADLRGVLPEDIQGNVTDDGHVFSGMVFAHPAVIFMKGHVKTPMHGTFNAPMGSGGPGKRIYIP